MTVSPPPSDTAGEAWWQTGIIDMEPGQIRYRGYAIEELIGTTSFSGMVWLMLRGELPTADQASLLDTALMAGVDHGPQAPSIAIARMAATCGVGLNNAMASGLNVLGDVHGGAGEQAVELYQTIAGKINEGQIREQALEQATRQIIKEHLSKPGAFIPGFGHRFHPVDPRAPRLLSLVDAAAQKGTISGLYATIARQIEQVLAQEKGKVIPLNIDGATAVIYAELGFAAPLARGLFCLSRAVGILAHAWEQTQQGGRNKGPLPPPQTWSYNGPGPRPVK